MKKNYTVMITTIAFVLIASIILFIFYLQSSGQIQFLPDRFAEEFWKFLASLASITFGFFLINVFWARRERQEKVNQARSILINYLLRINRIASKISEQLALNYSEIDFEESQKRDNEVVTLVKKMEKLANSIENITFDPSILSDSIIKDVFIGLIWEELLPNIENLSRKENFRADFEAFLTLVSALSNRSSEGIKSFLSQVDGGKVERS